MAERRRTVGTETWYRLREWDKGQAAAERLAAQAIQAEGYKSVDPSHPVGGPDGLKDIVCSKDGRKWVGACYFPRGEQKFSSIERKFKKDLKGVAKNKASGLVFVTN